MTKEYHKTPLHSENSSNSSDENSPITMSKLLKTDEIEMMESHDYASPQELKKGFEKIDGIKKKNLIYEPLPPRNKKNGFTKTAHSSSYDEEQLLHHKNDNNLQRKLHRFLFFVILLMSLSAFSLSVLTTLGVIQASCNKCIKDVYIPAISTPPLNEGQIFDAVKFYELQNNITYLTQVAILLRDQVRYLEGNLSITKSAATQRGPPGDYYLKKCEYKIQSVSTAFLMQGYDQSSVELTITAEKNFIIIGVTCVGGAESGLFQENNGVETIYKCKCAGQAKTQLFKTDDLKCRAHYWQCPFAT